MPEQERLRSHGERVPGAARKDPAECRQQDSVVRLEPGPLDLATKDRQLVAKHENLQFLGAVAAADEHDQLEHTADGDVES
jgi:hypothetical protein